MQSRTCNPLHIRSQLEKRARLHKTLTAPRTASSDPFVFTALCCTALLECGDPCGIQGGD